MGAIKRSDTILFMLSSNSVGSEWAMDELDFARKEGKRIVLVDLEHTKMPDDIWFRYHRYDTIDWQSQPQRNKLLRDLRSWFGKSQPKPQPATKPQPQPRIEPKPQPQAVQTTNYTQLRQSQTRPVTKPNQPATNKKQIVWGIAGAALIALLIVLLTRSSHSSSSIEESDYAASVGLCPDGNHPHIIDLGLPSGTKWAFCNVGASKPEEYGDYFAWGETRQKSNYDWSTYRWCNGSDTTLTKYNTNSIHGIVDNRTQLDLSDDVARARWGVSWCMPTNVDIGELKTNCTYEWTTNNGVNGGKFTSRCNGRSVFLPAAGNLVDSKLCLAGSDGYYWSSSIDEEAPYFACGLSFDS